MKPLTVSIEVPNPPEQVYEYLDVIGNHEQFTDHFLVDWQVSGPRRGLGAKANVQAKVIGERDRTDFEIVEVDSDRRIVEESTGGSRGRRRLRGTYHLDSLPDGGTRIRFELEFLELPPRERLMGPLNRVYLRRLNAKSMKRLSDRLAELSA